MPVFTHKFFGRALFCVLFHAFVNWLGISSIGVQGDRPPEPAPSGGIIPSDRNDIVLTLFYEVRHVKSE